MFAPAVEAEDDIVRFLLAPVDDEDAVDVGGFGALDAARVDSAGPSRRKAPPEPADVRALRQGHLLAQQPAQEGDAFRQSFERPPDATFLNLGGGRRSCAAARQSGALVDKLLEARHGHTAVGEIPSSHAGRNARTKSSGQAQDAS